MIKDYYPGMGQAVADRTVNRPGETWKDVAERVAVGNASLTDGADEALLRDHLQRATVLMSGRHLQHGDATQQTRNQEVFTNCSTGMTRAQTFYLLLNGSGVGASYDDDISIVDWRYMPITVPVLSREHKDWDARWLTREQAELQAKDQGRKVVYFRVPDSREGWAYAIEAMEELTWGRKHTHSYLILDFSEVRPKGAPIMGMQGRPSSGPIPLMEGIERCAAVKYEDDWKPWRQAMQIDHEFAECVLVGGARRSARIAVKFWKDPDILEFVRVKREGGLWSANNSVGVDKEFWESVDQGGLGATVLDAIRSESYGSGEPGMLNLDLLHQGEVRPSVDEIMELSGRFRPSQTSLALRRTLAGILADKQYWLIVNPCGEIRLFLGGGYCVIADVVPYHAKDQLDFEMACRAATRALMRTNLMPAMYQGEVARTNRIGVGPTGLAEYALAKFGLTFRDLIAPEPGEWIKDANGGWMEAPSFKALPFWLSLEAAAYAIEDECKSYADELDVEVPATRRTIKPAGTTSKLFGLTEGAHLPPMRFFLRWVQFRSDDPLVADYAARGYPTRELKTYRGTTIVGFPTKMEIANIATFPEQIVTAPEASPFEQFRWLHLLERYWLLPEGGNQVSYTLKYDPKQVDEELFGAMLKKYMRTVRAVSVMPTVDTSTYEYLPEEEITLDLYNDLQAHITSKVQKEEVDRAHVECAGGFCPIDFTDRIKANA